MMKQLCLTCFAIAITFASLAQDEWTIEECILYAIDNSLAVELAEVNLSSADVDRRRAIQSRWPNLNVSSSLGLNFGRVINPSTNTFETDDSYFNSFSAGSSVPLFAGNQVNNSIKQAKVDLEASGEDLKQTRVQLAFDVSNAFINVLFSQENLRNAEVALELSQQQLEQIDKLIRAGSRPEAERFDILAQISLDEQDVVRFENDIIQNFLILKQLMQIDPSTEMQLVRPEFDEDILNRIDTYTFDQVYEQALITQPQVKAQQLRIQSAEYDEKLAKGGYYPSLTLSGNVVTNYTDLDQQVKNSELQRVDLGELIVNDVPVQVEQDVLVPTEFETKPYGSQLSDNLGFGFAVSLTVPIYNNFSTKANVEQAKLGILRARNQDAQIRQNLKTDIQNALASARAAREALEASRAAFDAAELAYQNSQRRFDVGSLNSYELIEARNRLDSSRVNKTLARYDYVFRILVLEYYLGQGVKYE